MKVFLSNRLVANDKALVGVLEPAFLGGFALAENIPVRGGRPVLFKKHIERLGHGLKALGARPVKEALVQTACKRTIQANSLKTGSLRLRVFPAFGTRDMPFLVVIPLEWETPPPRSMRLMTVAGRHFGPAFLQARLKSSSMLPNLLAKAESQMWADDGLRLTPDGLVAEGVWTSLYIIKGRTLLAPPAHQGILEGVTLAEVIRKWRRKGGKCRQVPLTRYDLYTADEVWACSSGIGKIRIGEVDGRKIGPA